MLLYEDVLSGSEMFSDAYEIKSVDDMVYEINCSLITDKRGGQFDIGANPSTEEGLEEALDESSEQKLDIVHSFRLQKVEGFDQKSYMSHIREYMKTIKLHLKNNNPDRVEAFKSGATSYVKKILEDFENYDLYRGEGYHEPYMLALLNYRDDGITPYFTFWKDGLKEIKC